MAKVKLELDRATVVVILGNLAAQRALMVEALRFAPTPEGVTELVRDVGNLDATVTEIRIELVRNGLDPTKL